MIARTLLESRLDSAVFVVLVGLTALAARAWARRLGVAGTSRRPSYLLALGVALVGVGAAEIAARRAEEVHRDAAMTFGATYAFDLEQMGHASLAAYDSPNEHRYVALLAVARTWLKHNELIGELHTYRRGPDGRCVRILDVGGGAATDVPPSASISTSEPSPCTRAERGEFVFDTVPVADHRGVWVRGMVPVLDAQGKIDAVLVVGISYDHWCQAILATRGVTLAITWICHIAILGLIYASRQRSRLIVQQKTDARLRESEKRFRSLFENVPNIAVQGYDLQHRVIFWNQASVDLYGYTEAEAMGRPLEELIIPPPMRSEVARLIDQWVNGGPPIPAAELVLQRKDGAPVSVFSSHVMQLNTSGEPEMYCIDVDLTERNRAQEALTASEGNYRTLFEVIPHPMWVFDVESLRFLAVNSAAVAHYGYSREEFLSMRLQDIRPAADSAVLADRVPTLPANGTNGPTEWRHRKKNGEMIFVEITSHALNWAGKSARIVLAQDVSARREKDRQIREQAELLEKITEAIVVVDAKNRISFWNRGAERLFGHPAFEMNQFCLAGAATTPELRSLARAFMEHRGNWRGEMESVTKDGTPIWLETSIAVITDDRGEVSARLSVSSDITQRKALQSQVIEAQKMHVIGQLAGGVAHDFNSILMAMALNLEIMESDLGENTKVKPMLEELRFMNVRATRLVAQLLLFARKHAMSPEPIELNASVGAVMKMLQRVLGADIDLQVTSAVDPLWIMADPAMLDQVVLNLAVNARDAMPRGGLLRIVTDRREVNEAGVASHPDSKPGRYAVLSVTDTGYGMEPQVLARAFEPFFTTKGAGKGTGLGLSTVHGIAHQHGGWVAVDSTVGKGTTFEVYLPLMDPPKPGMVEEEKEEVRGGWETILLVEDDNAVRRIMAAILLRLGYHVLLSKDATEALEALDKHSRPVDLLITDVVLPGGTNGFELAQRLAGENPQMSIIIMSGYNLDAVSSEDASELGFTLLQKPVSSTKLATVVRETLDRRPDRSSESRRPW